MPHSVSSDRPHLGENSLQVLASTDGHRALTVGEKDDVAAEVAGLRQRLASQPVIEQAKGLLMGHYGISADVAFAVLCRWSQTSNTKLRDIATTLVQAAAQETPSQPGQNQLLDYTIDHLSQGSPRHDP